MKRILCLGDACVDVLIPYGQALRGEDCEVRFFSGGTAANTASGLGRLGAEVLFLGKAGKDYYGKKMMEDLEMDGVDTSLFELREDLISTQILAVIDENGERLPFLVPRKEPGHLEIYDSDLPDALLDRFDILHTTGLMLFESPAKESVVGFMKRCRAAGKTVSLDINLRLETVALDTSCLYAAIGYTDILFGSKEEELLPLTKTGDCGEFAEGHGIVVARRGKEGADIYTEQGMFHSEGFPVEVADTLGAGDAFDSGFLFCIAQGGTPEEAARFGNAAAAMNIRKAGARNCPSAAELQEFLASFE